MEITTMTSDDSRDEVFVMVRVDMAAICRKLTGRSEPTLLTTARDPIIISRQGGSSSAVERQLPNLTIPPNP
jgi:hypothetical protein